LLATSPILNEAAGVVNRAQLVSSRRLHLLCHIPQPISLSEPNPALYALRRVLKPHIPYAVEAVLLATVVQPTRPLAS
jgi:hypothetical protein